MLVVDTNVAVRACDGREGFELLGDEELVAPPLLWSEFTSLVHEAVWRREIDRRQGLRLLDRLDATPVPTPDGRAVDGDDARVGTALTLYNKASWPFLSQALADLQHGNGERMRRAADLFYGRDVGGFAQELFDRYFTITALEQDYPRDVDAYLQAGKQSWTEHEHFWWNSGYLELNYGLYPLPSSFGISRVMAGL